MDVLFRLAESLETFHLTNWAAAHIYHTQYALADRLLQLPADVLIKIAAPILKQLRRGAPRTPLKIILVGFSGPTVAEFENILNMGGRGIGGSINTTTVRSYARREVMEAAIHPQPASEMIYITGEQESVLSPEQLKMLFTDYAAKLENRTYASITRIILETAPLERVKNIWNPQFRNTAQNWFENSFETSKARITVPPVTIAYTK